MNCVHPACKTILVIAVSAVCLLQTGCSIPSFEDPQCEEARTAVRAFYSFHFGNHVNAGTQDLKLREKFLTPELFHELSKTDAAKTDYFTRGTVFPTSFRVGGCRANSTGKCTLDVVLLWRDDNQSKQTEIDVDTVKDGDEWKVSRVSDK